ncbi:hypothetical protein [Polaromonas sp. A23]|nr:hypothetical protein [Polaromonas sp. A23]
MSLSQAKATTDRVLAGERVILTASSQKAAEMLLKLLIELGVHAELTDV